MTKQHIELLLEEIKAHLETLREFKEYCFSWANWAHGSKHRESEVGWVTKSKSLDYQISVLEAKQKGLLRAKEAPDDPRD